MPSHLADQLPPAVSSGTYDLMLRSFHTANYFNKAPKVVLSFTIVSTGQFHGAVVNRYYNVNRIIGKPQMGGRFVPSATGDFAREFYTLFTYGGTRLDRLPMSLFDGKVIKAKVRMVTHARGADIPKPLQYAKVAQLLKVVEE